MIFPPSKALPSARAISIYLHSRVPRYWEFSLLFLMLLYRVIGQIKFECSMISGLFPLHIALISKEIIKIHLQNHFVHQFVFISVLIFFGFSLISSIPPFWNRSIYSVLFYFWDKTPWPRQLIKEGFIVHWKYHNNPFGLQGFTDMRECFES